MATSLSQLAGTISSNSLYQNSNYTTVQSKYITAQPTYATMQFDPYYDRLNLKLPDGRTLSVRTDVMPCYCHAGKDEWRKCPVKEHNLLPPTPQELDRVRIGDKFVVLMTNGQLRHEPAV